MIAHSKLLLQKRLLDVRQISLDADQTRGNSIRADRTAETSAELGELCRETFQFAGIFGTLCRIQAIEVDGIRPLCR